ncbi:MAG: aldehyde dehydrogenase family protein [Armatimonadota bacterium]
MSLDEKKVSRIVEDILEKVMTRTPPAGAVPDAGIKIMPEVAMENGAFETVDQAVENAALAFRKFQKISLETRKKIIENMRKASRDNAVMLAETAVRETGLGRLEDKINKNLLCADKTPGVEDLESKAFSGDKGLTLTEMAPYGVIGAITPTTNPAATVINNSISMVAAGNAVVYNHHPGARKTSIKTLQILNDAIKEAGGPENLLTCVFNPTIESSQALMKHKGIRLLVVTGGPAVVKQAMGSGKKTIAAGPGNPPVVVDETADIGKAVKDIINGASFDNNIGCIAEKEVFVVEKVAEDLIRNFKNQGQYELSGKELDKVMDIIFQDKGAGCAHPVMNKNFVGKPASYIAKSAGISVPADTRLLFCVVEKDHPLVLAEQLMPVLPVVRVPDVKKAIDWAVEVEHGGRHTAVMHSKNIENLHMMACKVDASIFVKNAPSYAGLGFGGEGYTTMTIASPTGEGLTSAKTFSRLRRCTLADYFRIV